MPCQTAGPTRCARFAPVYWATNVDVYPAVTCSSPNPSQNHMTPGKDAAILSNCDSLSVFLDGQPLAELNPARDRFPNLSWPPFFCDLEAPGTDLRIDGYLGDRIALSRSFSSDRSRDRFVAAADDAESRHEPFKHHQDDVLLDGPVHEQPLGAPVGGNGCDAGPDCIGA